MVLPGDLDLVQNSDLPPPAKLFQGGSAAEEHRRLLKALRLSQTRAREAEEEAAALTESNGRLNSLLIRESMRLLAQKHWLKLLEMERNFAGAGEDDGVGGGAASTLVIVCLGIAGVGFLLSLKILPLRMG